MTRRVTASPPPIDRGLLTGLVGFALRRAQFAVFRDFGRAMADLPVPLSPGEFGILVLVERNPELSQTALARAIGVDRSTLVPILDRLERHGLVARKAAPRDRRRHALALGRRGTRRWLDTSRPCAGARAAHPARAVAARKRPAAAPARPPARGRALSAVVGRGRLRQVSAPLFRGEWAEHECMDGDHRMTATEILERFNGSRPPAIETLGGEVIAVEPETGRLTFRFRPTVAMCHSIGIPEGGIVQGGFVAGWLDTAMAHACSARSSFTLRHPTLELKVSYLAPAHPNRTYYVDAEIVRWGRTIAFTEARLRDEHQRLVATASATAMLMPAK